MAEADQKLATWGTGYSEVDQMPFVPESSFSEALGASFIGGMVRSRQAAEAVIGGVDWLADPLLGKELTKDDFRHIVGDRKITFRPGIRAGEAFRAANQYDLEFVRNNARTYGLAGWYGDITAGFVGSFFTDPAQVVGIGASRVLTIGASALGATRFAKQAAWLAGDTLGAAGARFGMTLTPELGFEKALAGYTGKEYGLWDAAVDAAGELALEGIIHGVDLARAGAGKVLVAATDARYAAKARAEAKVAAAQPTVAATIQSAQQAPATATPAAQPTIEATLQDAEAPVATPAAGVNTSLFPDTQPGGVEYDPTKEPLGDPVAKAQAGTRVARLEQKAAKLDREIAAAVEAGIPESEVAPAREQLAKTVAKLDAEKANAAKNPETAARKKAAQPEVPIEVLMMHTAALENGANVSPADVATEMEKAEAAMASPTVAEPEIPTLNEGPELMAPPAAAPQAVAPQPAVPEAAVGAPEEPKKKVRKAKRKINAAVANELVGLDHGLEVSTALSEAVEDLKVAEEAYTKAIKKMMDPEKAEVELNAMKQYQEKAKTVVKKAIACGRGKA